MLHTLACVRQKAYVCLQIGQSALCKGRRQVEKGREKEEPYKYTVRFKNVNDEKRTSL